VKIPEPATADDWIRFEARYAEAARVAGAPVPRLLGVESLAGRAVSVWARVEGASVWQHVVDRPRRAAELGRLMADLQRDLFELPATVTLPRQRDRLMSKIRRTAATIDPALGRALELVGEPSRSCLCHGDFHPSNVILGPDGPTIVDWFDACRGEPIADAARSVLVLRCDGEQPPRHLPGSDRATLVALADAYVARLEEHVDLDPDAFARWQAVNAVARMAEGVPREVLFEAWTRFAAGGSAYAAAS
jgi:aminoglycoside phosphotransferase (APT) family kinase protein